LETSSADRLLHAPLGLGDLAAEEVSEPILATEEVSEASNGNAHLGTQGELDDLSPKCRAVGMGGSRTADGKGEAMDA